MKKNAQFTGLTGVALRGFFTNLQGKVIQKKVVDVKLRPNGRITPVHLIGWAKSRGFVADTLQSGVIRIASSPIRVG
jgi:hypothetical protein